MGMCLCILKLSLKLFKIRTSHQHFNQTSAELAYVYAYVFRLSGFIQLKREDKDMLIEKLGKGEKK